MGPIIVFLIIAVIAVIIAANCVKIVPQANAMVVERLGVYLSTWNVGLHIKVPFIDRIAKRVILKEQVVDFPPQPVITKDNVTMQIDTVIYYAIYDAKLYAYGAVNPISALANLAATTLRNIVGELELDGTLTSRDTINAKMTEILDEATDKWGIKVNRVELQDITPPDTVRRAMEQQMQAERERRAQILKSEGEKQSTILKSEGDKQSQVNEAEAEKQAQILLAEGEAQAKILQAEAEAKAKVLQAEAEAEAIRQVTEAIQSSKADPASYLLAVKYIDSLKEMVSGKDNKTVYIPYEATSVLSSLGSIKELLGQGGK